MSAASPHSPEIKLQVRGLAKVYGQTTALDHVDLDVRKGELLTLLGPSGSGKTTLLQLICGLQDPSAGSVIIDGKDQTHAPVNKRDIGVVFQNYALFPHMTVAENVGFALKMRKVSRSEIAAKVARALETVGLAHAAGRLPTQLSGGQQQRVALARCLVYDPAIILMDEPLSALDAKLREIMQIEIKRIHRETGATIIFVTHDQQEALALSDRVCLMNDGRIAQLGTPQAMYETPENLFVADFIGVSSIIRGTVRGGQLHGPFGALPIHGATPADGTEGALVIRPEAITLGEGAYEGQVTETVYGGSELRVILNAGGQEIILRAPAQDGEPLVGKTVRFGWAPEAARFLKD
ncbi:ABC transporter ATP-binding protein [Paracoccus aminophilus]|uniref:Spermidine/putrescine ABC transporter, ATPase subunit n=1 Tax=Paracoccus aminophilus JCM 7686 TaxID=1367847 RepID=S5YUM2_PARAH|nr:ABC transporter ATP-binding protein [Paracoccus aminophilus]AGT08931.1 spermidine/putrescine ABC transporter, ATPase subunit [Paracoccus aminophilus JCM 7686]